MTIFQKIAILASIHYFLPMNVSELARQLHVPVRDLFEILPQYGFDIGARAVKIDDRVAGKIIQQIAPIVGGKGGGKPENARGGGKDASKLDEALAKARSLLE